MLVPIELAATGKSDRLEASPAELNSGRKAAAPGAVVADLRPAALLGRPTRTIEVVGNGQWHVAPDRAPDQSYGRNVRAVRPAKRSGKCRTRTKSGRRAGGETLRHG